VLANKRDADQKRKKRVRGGEGRGKNGTEKRETFVLREFPSQ